MRFKHRLTLATDEDFVAELEDELDLINGKVDKVIEGIFKDVCSYESELNGCETSCDENCGINKIKKKFIK